MERVVECQDGSSNALIDRGILPELCTRVALEVQLEGLTLTLTLTLT